MGEKKDTDWLTNTSLSLAFKTLSCSLFCTKKFLYFLTSMHRSKDSFLIYFSSHLCSLKWKQEKIQEANSFVQIHSINKWTNKSTYFLKNYNVNSKNLQYPFWRTLISPITCNTQPIRCNSVSLNLTGNSFAITSRKVHGQDLSHLISDVYSVHVYIWANLPRVPGTTVGYINPILYVCPGETHPGRDL